MTINWNVSVFVGSPREVKIGNASLAVVGNFATTLYEYK
jgi:hypothetical protein